MEADRSAAWAMGMAPASDSIRVDVHLAASTQDLAGIRNDIAAATGERLRSLSFPTALSSGR